MNKAERVTRDLLKNVVPNRNPDGVTLRHAAWMMNNLPQTPQKRDRWIGYVQYLLVSNGVISLQGLMKATWVQPGEETSHVEDET